MMMSIRPVLLGLALVGLTGVNARSQYNYPGGYGGGGYGFGGFGGSTPQGNILQGMGAYAEGEGIYNYETSQARSINTDTTMRFNQYLWNSELEARHRYATHQAAKLNMNRAHYQALQSQVRDHPTKSDIDSGSALNVILEQLTDPKVVSGSGATLRLADGKIPASAVREIPFRDQTDAITISLDQMTDPNSWPAPLRADDFTPEREAYQKAVDDALAEDKDGGTLKPATISKVRNAVSQLYSKVEATIPKSKQPDHLQAMNYLKGLAGLSRMLERPNVEAVLSELEKLESTTVGHLVAFMHSFNLRFAPATTPKQVAVYRDLYAVMVADRDKVLGKPTENDNGTPASKVENPTEIFHGFDPNHLHPKAGANNTPAPPTPNPANADSSAAKP